jgi:hypothetical protein
MYDLSLRRRLGRLTTLGVQIIVDCRQAPRHPDIFHWSGNGGWLILGMTL